ILNLEVPYRSGEWALRRAHRELSWWSLRSLIRLSWFPGTAMYISGTNALRFWSCGLQGLPAREKAVGGWQDSAPCDSQNGIYGILARGSGISPGHTALTSAREPAHNLIFQESKRMLRPSIKRRIVGIATGMIILAVITSVMSMALASRVGHLLDELTNRYIPAYADLARVDIRSLERALMLRRMIIAKMQTPPDEASAATHLKAFEEKGPEVQREAEAARKLINAIIDDPSTPSDNVALTRIDERIDTAVNDLRHRLDEEIGQLFRQLEGRNFTEVLNGLARVDALRDEFNQKMDVIRADMLGQVHMSASTVVRNQQRAIWISAIVTAIAAALGLIFAMLVGSGITRPVYRLLEGTREVEAGRFDKSIPVTTRDEIGQLSIAFNRMIDRLRNNERIRDIFGRYMDPRVAQDLLDQPAVVATQGQRRVMTVMFCDMKGFTTLSEGVTPQGLVKVMNR